MSNKKIVIIIAVLGMIVFLAGLYDSEFTRINCRFALFIAEMKQYGLGMFPTLYGKPYTDYPSLHIFLMYLASLGGTSINMLTATLPSAAMAVFTLIMTYLIGSRVSRLLGGYAVVLCLLSFEFLGIARAPSLDMFVAATTILSFYLIYTADQDKNWKKLLPVPLCLLAGYAIRGPLGLIIPAAVGIAYYLINRNWKMGIIFAVSAGLSAVCCMWLWLWLCFEQGGRELLELFFTDQILSRLDKGKPIWYFFTNGTASYAVTYPLGLLVLIVYGKKLFAKPVAADSQELRLLRGLAAWMLIVLLGMSIPGTKHLRYIVAIIPAAALAAGWIFVNFDNLKLFLQIRNLLIPILRLLPFLALGALIIGKIVLRIVLPDMPLPFIIPALLLILAGIGIVKFSKAEPQRRNFAFLTVAAATLVIIQVAILEPIDQYREGSRDFIAAAEKLRQNHKVCFFRLGPDGDELKYLINIPPERRFVGEYVIPNGQYNPRGGAVQRAAAVQPAPPAPSLELSLVNAILAQFPADTGKKYPPITPRFDISSDYDKLLSYPHGTIFISREEYYEKYMPSTLKEKFEIIATGQLGHQNGIIFRRKNVSTVPDAQAISSIKSRKTL